jgi:hypothetical protein
MCDWIDNALVFSLQSEDLIYGTLKMDVSVTNYIGFETRTAGKAGAER